MSVTKFRTPEDLAVVIDCEAFKPSRRNPDGGMAFSPDQTRALDALTKLLTQRNADGKRTVLVLAGYAGTGKTTVMKELMRRLESEGQRVALLAPTGKASARLSESTGRKAQTVHSFIYGAPAQVGTCPRCGQLSPELGLSTAALRKTGQTAWTCPHCAERIPLAYGDKIERELGFQPKKTSGEEAGLPSVAIIDEASMVDEKLGKDITSYLPPNYAVLYVGDKGQLPPVKGKWGADFDHPTAELTQVHRQATGNPIVNLATRIRELKNKLNPFQLDKGVEGGQHLVARSASLQEAAAWLTKAREAKVDATLVCYTNKKRQALNEAVRRMRGLEAESKKTGLKLVRADRVLVLANNKDAGLTNGEVLIVEKSWFPEGGLRKEGFIWVTLYKRGDFLVRADLIGEKYENWRDEVKDYTSDYLRAERAIQSIEKGFDSGMSGEAEEELMDMLEMSAEERFDTFGAIAPRDLVHVDYGECITVHKSQGSQWRYVGIVWDYPTEQLYYNGSEKDRLEGVRWLYTAVTRASEYLFVFKV